MLTLLFAKFAGPLIAGAGIIAAIFAALFVAKKKGKAEAQVEHAQQNAVRDVAAARHEVETITEAQNVQADTGKLNDGVAADRLRDQWSRD